MEAAYGQALPRGITHITASSKTKLIKTKHPSLRIIIYGGFFMYASQKKIQGEKYLFFGLIISNLKNIMVI